MKYFLIPLLAFVAMFDLRVAQAGECELPILNKEYVERTDLIFEGRLSENQSVELSPSSGESLEDVLTITKLWKGDESGDVTITQGIYHGRGIYSGREYLIFASKSLDDTYSTSGCEVFVEITDEKPREIIFLENYFGNIKKEEKE